MNNEHTQTVVLDIDKPTNANIAPTVNTPNQAEASLEDAKSTSDEYDFTKTYSYLT